jgi:hypothetical protein
MAEQHRFREAIILDSNLLLLLVVGTWNPRAISAQKRLGGLSFADFLLLTTYLSSYRRILTTAHVLTEVSNLAGGASGATRAAIFSQLIRTISTLHEQHLPASLLIRQQEIMPFGITDAAISLLCNDHPLLTMDGRLARHLQLRGLTALTLDHLRGMRDHSNRN